MGGFLERLKEEMSKKNISQYQLAKLIGAKTNTVNNWFKGRAKCPRDNYLNKIAEIFHVHPAWLKYGDKEYALTLKDEIMQIAEKMQSYKPETIEKIAKIIDALDDTKKTQKKIA